MCAMVRKQAQPPESMTCCGEECGPPGNRMGQRGVATGSVRGLIIQEACSARRTSFCRKQHTGSWADHFLVRLRCLFTDPNPRNVMCQDHTLWDLTNTEGAGGKKTWKEKDGVLLRSHGKERARTHPFIPNNEVQEALITWYPNPPDHEQRGCAEVATVLCCSVGTYHEPGLAKHPQLKGEMGQKPCLLDAQFSKEDRHGHKWPQHCELKALPKKLSKLRRNTVFLECYGRPSPGHCL